MTFPNINPDAVTMTPVPFHRAGKGADGALHFHEPHPFLQRTWSIDFSLLDQAERELIAAHYAAYRSAADVFFDPVDWSIANGLVGTGDGATTIFTLPCKETLGLVVRVAGVGTAVTLLPGTGANGEDRIQFALAPANGAEIRFDSTGARERVDVYYDPDARIQFGWREARIYTASGIVLLEKIT